jgi:hypothetical protein
MLLSLNQREAAELSGIKQATISFLERGEKKFIPTEYIQFLCEKGIDLNCIFNEQSEDITFIHHFQQAIEQINNYGDRIDNSSLSVNNEKHENSVKIKIIYHYKQIPGNTSDFKHIKLQLEKIRVKK